MPFYIQAPFILRHFAGCAVWPFILLKDKALVNDPIFINHERIHLRQQLELLIIPFYIWYVLEYYCYRLRGKSKHSAYRSIRFEREAYDNEKNLDYLKSRKSGAFLKY